MYAYPHKRKVGGCTSKNSCNSQGSCVPNLLLCGCKSCAVHWRMLLLVNTSCAPALYWWQCKKYRDLLETVISSYSFEINRWYRVLGIFLAIYPVRHSNRRCSSKIKNRGLLHKYLMVPVAAHAHVRRKTIRKMKIFLKTEERKRGLCSYSRSPRFKPKQAFIALFSSVVAILCC